MTAHLAQLRRLRDLKRRKLRLRARGDSAAFAACYRRITPGPQQREMARRVDNEAIKYEADFWPRDHGKTEIFVVSYPLRMVVNDPDIRILIVQKTGTEAKKAVSVIKTELEENEELRADYTAHWRQVVGEPDIVNKAGMIDDKAGAWQQQRIYVKRNRRGKDPTVEAVGVGGAITGGHFDIIICDDILDDENTKTEDRCNKIINWFFGTITQLREPHTKLIVVGTIKTMMRNLYSELMNNPTWNVTIRSALLSHTPDEIEYTPKFELIDGKEVLTDVEVHTPDVQVMWPTVWPVEALVFDMLGSVRRIWTREKCNNLAAMAEQIFKSSMIRRYGSTPRFFRVIQSWDTAFKRTGDYSALTEWGEAAAGAYLTDLYRAKLEWPELALAIPLFYLCAKIRPAAVLIEDKASGQSAIQEYRSGKPRALFLQEMTRYREQPGARRDLVQMIDQVQHMSLPSVLRVPVIGVAADKDGVTRAEDASVWWQNGQVYHPAQAGAIKERLEAFEREWLNFPEVENDDWTISATQAVLWLLAGRKPRRTAQSVSMVTM